MDSILSFFGMIIVAIIGLIGIIMQNKSHSKIIKHDELVKSIDNKIDLLRTETKQDDIALNKKLDDARVNSLKRFLISELTRIKNGEHSINDFQERMLAEAKDEYNKAGGNSYVNEMYEEIKIIKKSKKII